MSQIRVCKGTKRVKGCGFPKDESEFYVTQWKWRNNVCIECTKKHKREKYRVDLNVLKIANGAW